MQTFVVIDEGNTLELPNGDEALEWENLEAKIMPATGAKLVEFNLEFHTKKLDSEG